MTLPFEPGSSKPICIAPPTDNRLPFTKLFSKTQFLTSESIPYAPNPAAAEKLAEPSMYAVLLKN